MHFVSPNPGGPALLVEFLTAGDIAVMDFSQPSELQDAVSLMEKYSDTPIHGLRGMPPWSSWLSDWGSWRL